MNNEWSIPMRKQMLPIAAYKIKWVIKDGHQCLSLSLFAEGGSIFGVRKTGAFFIQFSAECGGGGSKQREFILELLLILLG
jgi:hypothetical protein